MSAANGSDILDLVPQEVAARLAELLCRGEVDLAALCGLADDEMDAAFAVAVALIDTLPERAIDCLNGLLVLRPSQWRYHRALGIAYQRAQNHPLAAVALGTALLYNPNDRISLILRAESEMLAVDAAQARVDLEAVLTGAAPSEEETPYFERAQALLDYFAARRPTEATP